MNRRREPALICVKPAPEGGQFDDLERPAYTILEDDERTK
jgi:hypothetical protein